MFFFFIYLAYLLLKTIVKINIFLIYNTFIPSSIDENRYRVHIFKYEQLLRIVTMGKLIKLLHNTNCSGS